MDGASSFREQARLGRVDGVRVVPAALPPTSAVAEREGAASEVAQLTALLDGLKVGELLWRAASDAGTANGAHALARFACARW